MSKVGYRWVTQVGADIFFDDVFNLKRTAVIKYAASKRVYAEALHKISHSVFSSIQY